MIKINNLTKRYSGQIVLNGINHCFEKNRMHGVVGLNGVGKTTLFNVIANLTSFEGDVTFYDDKPKIGYLPSQLFIYPKTTGLEFINFCLAARGIKPDSIEIENLNRLFELPLKQEFAENYSDGMKKKLYILMLLLQKNDILILDEPFNNLDISTNIILKDLLGSLKGKKTILISSHILDPLKELCDTIIVLDEAVVKYSLLPKEFEKADSFFQKRKQFNIEEYQL